MKDLGAITMIQSNTIRLSNRMHLNSINRKRDTLCGVNFSWPESDTDEIVIKDGSLYTENGNKINQEAICQRCLKIAINNQQNNGK